MSVHGDIHSSTHNVSGDDVLGGVVSITGTSSSTFQVNASSGIILKDSSGTALIRNSTDTASAPITASLVKATNTTSTYSSYFDKLETLNESKFSTETLGVAGLGQGWYAGSAGYVSVPSVASDEGLSAFTIDLWWGNFVYNWEGLYYKTYAALGSANNYLYCVTYYNNLLRFRLRTSGGTYQCTHQTNPSNGAGVWHHVVATWDGSTMKLYLDNVVCTTPVATSGTMGTGYTSYPIVMGLAQSPDTTQMLNGRIDEVKVYSRAFSASEVSDSYASGNGTYDPIGTGCIGNWHFQNDLVDTSGVHSLGSFNGSGYGYAGGKVYVPGSVQSINVFRSIDASASGTQGLVYLGDSAGETVIQGTIIRAASGMGINTANSGTYALTTYGDALFQSIDTSTYARVNLGDRQTSGAEYGLYSGYPSAGFFTIRENTVANRIVIAKTTGNVGVGNFTATASAQLHVNTGDAARIAFIARAASAQTVDIMQIQDSSTNVLARFDSTGVLSIGNASSTGALKVYASTDASWHTNAVAKVKTDASGPVHGVLGQSTRNNGWSGVFYNSENGSRAYLGGGSTLDGGTFPKIGAHLDGSLVFISSDAATFYTAFSPPVLTANVLYTLPSAQGASNTYLKNNGSGTLSWAAPESTTIPQISSGAGAPSSTPSKIGDIYIDTTGGSEAYYGAVGTSSSGDWKKLSP